MRGLRRLHALHKYVIMAIANHALQGVGQHHRAFKEDRVPNKHEGKVAMQLHRHGLNSFALNAEGVHALLQLAVAHWEAGKAADAAPLLMRGLSIVQDHQRHTRGGRTVEASSRPMTVRLGLSRCHQQNNQAACTGWGCLMTFGMLVQVSVWMGQLCWMAHRAKRLASPKVLKGTGDCLNMYEHHQFRKLSAVLPLKLSVISNGMDSKLQLPFPVPVMYGCCQITEPNIRMEYKVVESLALCRVTPTQEVRLANSWIVPHGALGISLQHSHSSLS